MGKDNPADTTPDNPMETITKQQARSTWARMIQKVHDVNPLFCPKCGEKMRILAMITDRQEIKRVLEHLRRNKEPPFDNVYPWAS